MGVEGMGKDGKGLRLKILLGRRACFGLVFCLEEDNHFDSIF